MDKQIKEIDLIILGAGPAGMTAAIYASRAKIETLLLENAILGGQVRNSYVIENYPGFKAISGAELADKIQEQAEELGVTIDEFDPVVRVDFSDDEKIIETETYIYKATAVILATGATPKKLPIKSGNKFDGKGIHYCAVCDGAMYNDKIIAVVGGGNSALEEALFLTRFAKKVYIFRRYDYFKGERALIDEVSKNDKIEVLYNHDLVDVTGEVVVEKAILRNTITGDTVEKEVDAVFGYIGTEPKTSEFSQYIHLTENGYINTDENMKTNINGVYAAGDVREKQYRQITTAVADGTIAALEAEKFIISKRSEN